MNMKICFIGGGNMATALIGGLLAKGLPSSKIGVVEIDAANRERLRTAYQVPVFPSHDPLIIRDSDLVVLAVKPSQIKDVAIQLGPLLSGQIVLSIAAGVRLLDLARWLKIRDSRVVLVRAMPNTPALVGAGVAGLWSFPAKEKLAYGQVDQIESVIGAVGSFVWVQSEEDMDAVTAISGSGPAYFFYFIEALEQAGVGLGLPEQMARKLSLDTALGAAMLAQKGPEDPATLRARVTSKKGTTECALNSLEANHVRRHIIEAVQAAAVRSRELGDEMGRG
jgi:pyrroline-5-carboxylate reductase